MKVNFTVVLVAGHHSPINIHFYCNTCQEMIKWDCWADYIKKLPIQKLLYNNLLYESFERKAPNLNSSLDKPLAYISSFAPASLQKMNWFMTIETILIHIYVCISFDRRNNSQLLTHSNHVRSQIAQGDYNLLPHFNVIIKYL